MQKESAHLVTDLSWYTKGIYCMHQKCGVPQVDTLQLEEKEVAFWTRRPLLKMQLTTQKPSNIKITDTKGIKLWPSILLFNTVTKTATLAVNTQLSVTFGTVSFQNTNTISSFEDSKCNRIWTEPRVSIYFHIANTY